MSRFFHNVSYMTIWVQKCHWDHKCCFGRAIGIFLKYILHRCVMKSDFPRPILSKDLIENVQNKPFWPVVALYTVNMPIFPMFLESLPNFSV